MMNIIVVNHPVDREQEVRKNEKQANTSVEFSSISSSIMLTKHIANE